MHDVLVKTKKNRNVIVSLKKINNGDSDKLNVTVSL